MAASTSAFGSRGKAKSAASGAHSRAARPGTRTTCPSCSICQCHGMVASAADLHTDRRAGQKKAMRDDKKG